MNFKEITLILLEGFAANCQIFFLTLLFAIPLGLIISFGSMSKFAPFSFLAKFCKQKKKLNFWYNLLKYMSQFKPIAFITKLVVWIIRGTPLMLQLLVVVYIPGLVFDYPIKNRLLATLIAFVINYACYFSEIYRGGIESIPKGQYEAGAVLGMTKSQVFFKVVLMQVVKRIIAPMGNEVITLVKDTSLARVVSFAEILRAAERFTARGVIWPLFYTGAFFLVFNGVVTILLNKIEKKFDYYRG